MAPNLKHRSPLLQTVDSFLAQPAFPPITFVKVEQTKSQPQVIESSRQDCSDYWVWSADNDEEIKKIVDEQRFSADHIVGNLQRQKAVKAAALSADNDQYWDWSHAKKESSDYWNWEATNDEQGVALTASAAETDSYRAW